MFVQNVVSFHRVQKWKNRIQNVGIRADNVQYQVHFVFLKTRFYTDFVVGCALVLLKGVTFYQVEKFEHIIENKDTLFNALVSTFFQELSLSHAPQKLFWKSYIWFSQEHWTLTFHVMLNAEQKQKTPFFHFFKNTRTVLTHKKSAARQIEFVFFRFYVFFQKHKKIYDFCNILCPTDSISKVLFHV